jgi:hypothetical protein
LEELAHLVEKSSIFDRIDRDKDLSGKQLKNFKFLDFCSYLPAHLIDFESQISRITGILLFKKIYKNY